MEYQDKTLNCVECGADFVFSASEQEFYANKGFMNEPKRCPDCRAARKQRQRGSSTSWDSNGFRRERQMFPAVCAACGRDTQVPFEPRDGRPVYCSECYSRQRD